MSAVATVDLGESPTRIRLEGAYPNMADPPSGCRFHTRCPRQLGDVCRTIEPPWQGDTAETAIDATSPLTN
jgi:peptide/nickel transport system ATP-binding protein